MNFTRLLVGWVVGVLSLNAAQVAYPRPSDWVIEYMERGTESMHVPRSPTFNIIFKEPRFSGTGAVTMSSNVAHSGRQSLKFSVSGAGYFNLEAGEITGSDVYARAYIRADNITLANGESLTVFSPSKVGFGNVCDVTLNKGASGLYYALSGVGSGTTIIPTNTWTCVEVRFKTGSGDGVRTLWINGVQELSSSTLTQTNAPSMVRFGIYANGSARSADIYIDDLQVSPSPIGVFDPGIKMVHPRLNSRIGAPLTIFTAGESVGDTIKVDLVKTGVSNVVFTADAVPLTNHTARLIITNLATGDWTLTARLLSSSGTEKATSSFSWNKPYSGDPKWSIDQYNRFTSNGVPFFPVANFLSYNSPYGEGAALWATNNYINCFNGGSDFDRNMPSEAWTPWLTTVEGYGFPITGPLLNFEAPGDPYAWTNLVNVRDKTWTYITNSAITNSEFFMGWNFYDEGTDLQNIPHDQTYEVWNMVETNTPSKWLKQNFMSTSFYGQGNVIEIRGAFWPWMIQDVYGVDLYPYGHSCLWSYWHFYDSIQRLREWNYNVVPVGGFVQTAGLLSSVASCGTEINESAPPLADIKLSSWLIPIVGGNFVDWYHHKNTVPSYAWDFKAEFVADVAALRSGLCGIPGDQISSSSTNVLCLSKTDGTTNYLFAANWSSNTLSGVTFTGSTSFESGKTVANYFGGTAPTMSDGSLSADFGSQEVRIFHWQSATQQRRKATIGRATLGRGTF